MHPVGQRNRCHGPGRSRGHAPHGALTQLGLGVNAGHDLNLVNLTRFCEMGEVAEVSIGHALIADALEFGLAETVRLYLDALAHAQPDPG